MNNYDFPWIRCFRGNDTESGNNIGDRNNKELVELDVAKYELDG